MRVLVAGVPRAGKTTLAEKLGREHRIAARHTDDLAGLEWSAASGAVAGWFNARQPWIIEGVAVPRALRKWLAANPGKPADIVYWLGAERLELTPGQATMAAGCRTVWAEVLPILTARRVTVLRPAQSREAPASVVPAAICQTEPELIFDENHREPSFWDGL